MIIHRHSLREKHAEFHNYTIGALQSIKQGLKNNENANV